MPVWGNNPGEPCYGTSCNQALEWPGDSGQLNQAAWGARLLVDAGAVLKAYGPGRTLLMSTARAKLASDRQGSAADPASIEISRILLDAGADPYPRSLVEGYLGLRSSEIAAKDNLTIGLPWQRFSPMRS